MFLLKKIISFFLSPFQTGLMLCLLGLVLIWFFRKKEKLGRVLLTIGVLWLCFFGLDPVAHFLMASLEDPYRPVKPYVVDDAHPSPEYIVVLAAGHQRDPQHPVTGALKFPALQRLAEGIRQHRQFPETKLILAGGLLSHGKKECETMREMSLLFGMQERDILLEGDSRDSKDQARILKSRIGDRPFVLVTSGNHMRRAVSLFKKQGMNPIPAPTAFITTGHDPDAIWIPFPNMGAVGTSYRALHENLGLLWAKLRGQSDPLK